MASRTWDGNVKDKDKVQIGKGAENKLNEVVVTAKKKAKQKTMAQSAKDAASTDTNLTGKGVKGTTRSQARKDSRMNNKATRRADRTAKKDPTAAKGTAKYEANLGAEENRIKTNRVKRREFAYNMAKAAGSGDAGSFDPRSRRTKGDILASNGSLESILAGAVDTPSKAKELENKMVNVGPGNDLQQSNKVLSEIEATKNMFDIAAPGESLSDYDKGNMGLAGQTDSNPSAFMRSAYAKKRGY